MTTDTGFYNSEINGEAKKQYMESHNYDSPFLAMIIVVGFALFLTFIFGVTSIVNWIYYLIIN
jgi:hypothetical protein